MGEAGEVISVDNGAIVVKGLSKRTSRATLPDSSLMPGDEIAIPDPNLDGFEISRLYRRAMLGNIHSGYIFTSDRKKIQVPNLVRVRRMNEEDLMVSLSELQIMIKEREYRVYYYRQKQEITKYSTDKWSRTVAWLEPT